MRRLVLVDSNTHSQTLLANDNRNTARTIYFLLLRNKITIPANADIHFKDIDLDIRIVKNDRDKTLFRLNLIELLEDLLTLKKEFIEELVGYTLSIPQKSSFKNTFTSPVDYSFDILIPFLYFNSQKISFETGLPLLGNLRIEIIYPSSISEGSFALYSYEEDKLLNLPLPLYRKIPFVPLSTEITKQLTSTREIIYSTIDTLDDEIDIYLNEDLIVNNTLTERYSLTPAPNSNALIYAFSKIYLNQIASYKMLINSDTSNSNERVIIYKEIISPVPLPTQREFIPPSSPFLPPSEL